MRSFSTGNGRPNLQAFFTILLGPSKIGIIIVALEIDLSSVIVVHDLASHRSTSRIQGEDSNVQGFWLEDVLQRDLPRARIMSFSPTSAVPPGTEFTVKGLKARGTELLKSICEERRDSVCTKKWIFHSSLTNLFIPEGGK